MKCIINLTGQWHIILMQHSQTALKRPCLILNVQANVKSGHCRNSSWFQSSSLQAGGLGQK